MKIKLILTLIFSILLTACSDFPPEGIIQGAILKQEKDYYFTIYNLDSYEITNSYTREKDNEEFITIDYKAKFKIKYDRESKEGKKFIPNFSPDIDIKEKSITLVKRGNSWYLN